MIIIGLTGSIGMGKTTVAGMFKELGAAILDSDSVVHTLLGPDGVAVRPVAKIFPDALEKNNINRKILGQSVFENPTKLYQLEAILHPLVRQAQDDFISEELASGTKIIVFDIPLLFETKGEKRCDYTIVATAPEAVQRARVFARPNMTEEKFARILARQMPDHEKQRRADFIVHTGESLDKTKEEVEEIWKQITN